MIRKKHIWSFPIPTFQLQVSPLRCRGWCWSHWQLISFHPVLTWKTTKSHQALCSLMMCKYFTANILVLSTIKINKSFQADIGNQEAGDMAVYTVRRYIFVNHEIFLSHSCHVAILLHFESGLCQYECLFFLSLHIYCVQHFVLRYFDSLHKWIFIWRVRCLQ